MKSELRSCSLASPGERWEGVSGGGKGGGGASGGILPNQSSDDEGDGSITGARVVSDDQIIIIPRLVASCTLIIASCTVEVAAVPLKAVAFGAWRGASSPVHIDR